jgi:hypothetical protein
MKKRRIEMLNKKLVNEIKTLMKRLINAKQVKESIQSPDDHYFVLSKSFENLIQRLELANTENKNVKYDSKYDVDLILSKNYDIKIKCPICGCSHRYGDSFTSFYAHDELFGQPICEDCYKCDMALRSNIEKFIN